MIQIFKTISEENTTLKQLDNIEPGCWINIVAPSDEELILIANKTGVDLDFLKASLDDEETSRIDIENTDISIIVDIPFTEMEDNSLTYDTYPLSIIHTSKYLITVCLKNSKILTDFINGRIKTFYTFKKSRFTLQILNRISTYYLLYLRQIDKKSLMIEKRLHKSMKNRELIQLHSLEKSLVYFSTSLKANEITLEKMLKLDIIQKYEDDKDVLENVIIENKQAIEMTEIYSNILASTMDFFASVISNNLNIVMKVLASVTILMAIPTIIGGIFGMNVWLPISPDDPMGFYIIMILTFLICGIVAWVLYKKDMFR
ncbi:MAG: magnesium transporter CorA family protein [Clostridium baratii]|uniref:CorA-like Mg2+ transporter family protein n=1 Tax=Clostridium baratii str. Sullivan TaxID=1415775 RepID=A0A0A7FUF9_9CLOT|nr:magnesium transporter CorA family protein [Clostridium baratii]AIY83237.1 corA-like Mg2+ transporter family protein [Clostridium baratii str. Sullivan]MBS6008110.1 magnesium transporter CorA family protein [Clostridium baratii]MDU1055369.1 magnesium transporter CorA family protein [Clostridium baratii]MDU4912771.1 magnesium transporter CorA family protein [Clostridium baratii]CUP84024.1 Mg2+ transporter protein%2C CorA family protein [Clostridium baratii]